MEDLRDIKLIGSTIRNGRIYMSAGDARFFPANCFGDRATTGGRGLPIDFIAAAEIVRTDIRYLSAARIGPRASFAAFLRSQHAKEGGRLSVTKLADRKYRLDYLD